MSGGKLVAVEIVGGGGALSETPTIGSWSETHTVRFVFRDFSSLPHERQKNKTNSSEVLCHGYKWRLRIYPGGDRKSREDAVFISAYLCCVSAEQYGCEIRAEYAFRVPALAAGNAGRVIRMKRSLENVFSKSNFIWGCTDVAPRADILDPAKKFLLDGSLAIEVDIQVYSDKPPIWTPKNRLSADYLKVLELANKTGDVTFQVGDEDYHAHCHILESRAPELAALAEGYPPETPIPIQDIRPSIFGALLRFIYANDVPGSNELRHDARDLLDVADRFGCTGLKLVAETEVAASGITVETAADLILYADAKNCALLKETAVKFFAANPTEVMASPGWTNVKESAVVLNELMEVLVAGGKKRSVPAPASSDERDYKRMCVSDLRRKLDENDLDVDGSREMLINRLEQQENEDGAEYSSDTSSDSSDASSEDN